MIGHTSPESALAKYPALRQALSDQFADQEVVPDLDQEDTAPIMRCPVECIGFETLLKVLSDSGGVDIIYEPQVPLGQMPRIDDKSH